jgi:hypothetical protein
MTYWFSWQDGQAIFPQEYTPHTLKKNRDDGRSPGKYFAARSRSLMNHSA